jgi:predicted permease
MISRLRIFAAKLQGLFAKRKAESEFDDEVRDHLRLLTERFVQQGMSPEEAASAARRQFGNVSLLQEDQREIRTLSSLETFWRNLRFGARQLRRNPLFTSFAVLSLALGIGANTAVFTLLDQLVLRLLPVKDPKQLVMLWSTGPYMGSTQGSRVLSYPMYQDFASKGQAFDFVVCRDDTTVAMNFNGSTERIDAELVSGNFFQALGVGPALGRVFSPEADDRIYNGHPFVVLNYRYWQNRFAADPNIIGKKILVNNYPMEIIGVSSPGFYGLDPSSSPQLWAPILMKAALEPSETDIAQRRTMWLQVFARMKPGYTLESARASLQPLFHQILVQELGEKELSTLSAYDRDLFLKRTVEAETAAGGYSELRFRYSTPLVVLMCMAGLILLIACSNVANLLIARAIARQKEIAVRLAIGASRRSLIGQLLVESLLLSLAGAALGIALSIVATRGLLHMLPGSGATLLLRAEPDFRILLFSIGVALASGLLFGLIPALQGTRLDLWSTLKDAVSSATGGSSSKLRKGLVTAQVALSFLLLIGAGLFVKTLINLKNTHTGLERIENLVTFQVDPEEISYTVPQISSFYQDILRDIRATPGVTSAAYATVPLLHGYAWVWPTAVEGYQAKDGEDMGAFGNVISPEYWKTMGIPLLQGRDFDDRDRFDVGDLKNAQAKPTVAIVNRSFAEHFFGQRSAIGLHIGYGGADKKSLDTPIVGVVEDSLYDGVRQGVHREVFYPHLEAPVRLGAFFYVRTTAESKAMFPLLRSIVAKHDPSISVDGMKTVQTQLDEALSTERLIASLSMVFGALATILAALGLYGVMAFIVARRTKEIGLRMALGAPQSSVQWLVLRDVLILLAIGLSAGIPCAYFLSRYVSSQLFGIAATDVWTYIAAIVLLGVMAAASGFLPARRASQVDPMIALRYE